MCACARTRACAHAQCQLMISPGHCHSFCLALLYLIHFVNIQIIFKISHLDSNENNSKNLLISDNHSSILNCKSILSYIYLYTGCISRAIPITASGWKWLNSWKRSLILLLYFKSKSSWTIRFISVRKKRKEGSLIWTSQKTRIRSTCKFFST